MKSMADSDQILQTARARSKFLTSLAKIPGFDEKTVVQDFSALMSPDTPDEDRKAFFLDIATHIPEYQNWQPEEIQTDLSGLFDNRRLSTPTPAQPIGPSEPQPPIRIGVPQSVAVAGSTETSGSTIQPFREKYEPKAFSLPEITTTGERREVDIKDPEVQKLIAGQNIEPRPISAGYETRFDPQELSEYLTGARFGKQLVSGAAGTLEGLAGGAAALGITSGEKAAAELGKFQTELQPPNPTFFDELFRGVGSSVVLIPTGIAAARIASKLGITSGAALARIAGSVAGGTESLTEAGQVWLDAKQKFGIAGADEAALRTFVANALILPISDRFGIFSEKRTGLLKGIYSAPIETVQEVAQQITSNLNMGRPPEEGVVESGAIGGLIGFGAGSMITSTEGKQPAEIQEVAQPAPVAPPVVEPVQQALPAPVSVEPRQEGTITGAEDLPKVEVPAPKEAPFPSTANPQGQFAVKQLEDAFLAARKSGTVFNLQKRITKELADAIGTDTRIIERFQRLQREVEGYNAATKKPQQEGLFPSTPAEVLPTQPEPPVAPQPPPKPPDIEPGTPVGEANVPKPPPTTPEAPKVPITHPEAKSVIEAAGLRYEGSNNNLHSFTDPVTGSTLAISTEKPVTPESIQEKIAESRAKDFPETKILREAGATPEQINALKTKVEAEDLIAKLGKKPPKTSTGGEKAVTILSDAEKETIARDMIRKHPKYQELLASKRRYLRSMYSAEETAAKMKQIELEPEDLLSAHAGVMNAKSTAAVKQKALADEIFRDTKLPRTSKGTFRGEDYRIAWDKFNPEPKPTEAATIPPASTGGEKQVQVVRYGEQESATLLEEYGGHQIVKLANGDVAVWEPSTENLLRPALDDKQGSETFGKIVPERNNVESARTYVDWLTKHRKEIGYKPVKQIPSTGGEKPPRPLVNPKATALKQDEQLRAQQAWDKKYGEKIAKEKPKPLTPSKLQEAKGRRLLVQESGIGASLAPIVEAKAKEAGLMSILKLNNQQMTDEATKLALEDILKGYTTLNEVEQTLASNPNVAFTTESGASVDAKVLQDAVDVIKKNPSLAPFATKYAALSNEEIKKVGPVPKSITKRLKKASDPTLSKEKPQIISNTKVLTPKEMKVFFTEQLQAVKAIVDGFKGEHEKINKAEQKEVSAEIAAETKEIEGLGTEEIANQNQEYWKKRNAITERYAKEGQKRAGRYNKQRQDLNTKIVAALAEVGYAANVTEAGVYLVTDIPGDGTFTTKVESLDQALERAKQFPSTTNSVAGPEGTPGLGVAITNYAAKKEGNFYSQVGDGWIIVKTGSEDRAAVMAVKAEAPKGMKPATGLGEIEKEDQAKMLKQVKEWASGSTKPAQKLGYVYSNSDWGAESASINPVPSEPQHASAVFKSDGKYIVVDQFLLNRAESFFENASYAVDESNRIHLQEKGKTVAMVSPHSLSTDIKTPTPTREQLLAYTKSFELLEKLSDPKQNDQKNRGASLSASLGIPIKPETVEKTMTHIGQQAERAFKGEATIPSDGLTEVAGELTHKSISWPKKLIRRLGIPSYVGNKVPSLKAAFYALRESFFEANERYEEVAAILESVRSELKPTAQESKRVSDAIWRGNDKDVQKYYSPLELKALKFTNREIELYNTLVNAQRLATNIRVDAMKYYLMNQPLTDRDIVGLDIDDYIPGSGSVEDKINELLNQNELETLKQAQQQVKTGKDRYPDDKDFQREFDAKVEAIKNVIKEVVVDDIATKQVNQLGGYISLKRSGGYYVHWQDPSGEKFYNQFQLGSEATEAAEKLARQGFTILGKGKVNDLNLSELYTKEMSLGELLDVIEELGIEDRPDVQKLVDEFKKRGFSAHMIRRQYTGGYDRTFDNAVRSIHDFALGASRNLARTKGRINTTNILKTIDTTKHQAEAELVAEYLNGYFNSQERSGSLLRRMVYVSALSWSPTFIIQQLLQPYTTHLANIALEIGGLKAPIILEQSNLLASAYVSGVFDAKRSFSAVADKMGSVDTKELTDFLKRAHDRQSIAGSMIEEFAGSVRLGGRITAPLTTQALMATTGMQKETIQNILIKGEQFMQFAGAVTERKNRIQGFIEGYLIGKQRGLSGDALYAFSERFTETVNIPYGKENLPITLLNIREPLTKSIARTFYIFLSFHNAVLHMAGNAVRAKGIPLDKKAAAVTYGTLSWIATSGLYGVPMAWLAQAIYSAISGGDDDPLKEVRNDPRLPEWMRTVLDAGVLALFGADLRKSLGLGETIPLENSVPLSIYRRFKGVAEELARGELKRAAQKLPVGAPPPVRGFLKLQEAREFGVRYGSKTVVPAEKLSTYDKMLIGLNITPYKVGKAFEIEAKIGEERARRSQEYDRIADSYADAYVRKDEKTKADIRRRIQEYNASVKERFPELMIATTKQSADAFERAVMDRIAAIRYGQRAAESERERSMRQRVEKERGVRP